MNFYNKLILPRLIDFIMNNNEREKDRAKIIPGVAGVVLEIGFGSGLNLPFYKGVTKLYALDPSKELWDLSKERRTKITFPIEWLNAPAEQIPLGDNSVDSVVMTWSLCSIPNPAQALAEIRRVLKEGGNFIFVEHGQSPKLKNKRWQNWLNPLWKKFAGGCNLNREPFKEIAAAGFKLIEQNEESKSFLDHLYKGVATK